MISRGKLPNIITYNAFSDGHCLRGQMDEALELKELMERNGYKPDVVTLNTLIAKARTLTEPLVCSKKYLTKGLYPMSLPITLL